MSKVITSPIPRWSGTVTLANPITEAQAIEIERTMAIVKEAGERVEEKSNFKELQHTLNKSAKLRAVLMCVEKWELQDFTVDPFPFSPKGDSNKLIAFLFDEILAVYEGDAFIPNE
jgi:hypothetical protein